MNITIDYQSRIPIYEQIVREIETQVALNILKPGEQIESIRDLALALSVNPNTIKKAYDILLAKGIITSKSTKGTFISNNASKAKDEKINYLLEEIKAKVKELETLGLTKKEIIDMLKK